ncbi:MAG: DNA polymerase [bacterium]|nr:DNA polymerase [bacterium]
MKNEKEKLVIIDSHALIHRAYHALPILTAPDGRQVQAVYGFASVLMRVIKELKPQYIVAAFDMAGPTFREKEYKEYKAHRPATDDALINQFSLVKELVEAFKIPVLQLQSYEADDIIGTVVEKLKNKKELTKIIVTGDLDCLQLIDDENILVYTLKKGVNDTVIYNEELVRERYEGLGPNQITDLKGLKGDASDNIPGVLGIGEKTAINLLNEYGSLENIYKAVEKEENFKSKTLSPKLIDKLVQGKDNAFLSKRLATIKRDVPVELDFIKTTFNLVENEEIKKLFFRFGFKSLIKRLDDLIGIEEVVQTTTSAIQEEQGLLIGDELDEYYKKGIFSEKIYKLEKDVRPVLRKMEKTGILLDVKLLKNLSEKFETELLEIKNKIIEFAGEEFNINSTQELGRILFEKLGLGGAKIKKTKKSGAYSTAFDQLDKLKNSHPIFPLILRWRELSKLKSTYVDALPRLVGVDGRLHTTFKQLGAVTGRLSSENPNLQNIPTKGEYGLEIRRAFVAPEGWLILAADYSQIELRVAAAMSGDEKMIDTFKKGEDIHTRTAAEVFNVSLDKVTKDMRREAKTLNFGVLYGMGPRAFSQSAGVTLSEAQEFIRQYEVGFSGLAKFIRDMKSKARAQGYVETLWGRKRFIDLNSPNPMMRAAAEREAVNMPIQGTATGDIVKAAMVEIGKELGSKKDIKMILQVHDELVFEVKEDMAERYSKIVKDIMENVADIGVPLVAEVEVGKNWGDLLPVAKIANKR